jgi:PAS domain S-box-containing protein
MNSTQKFMDSLTEEGRYRLLLQGIRDYAIYMLDPDGMITSWNAGAERLKGYTADEVLGTNFSRFYLPDAQAEGQPARNLGIALREGTYEGEGWRVRRDGSLFWAHVVIDPIFSPAGEHLGFAKVTRDLTERKAAEEALKASEQQFRLLVQGVTDYAIFMLDRDGNVASWNSGAQRIKGYAPEEIIGQHFSRFYTEEDRQLGEPQRALEEAAKSGRFEKEAWRVRKDGTRFWANVVIDAIRNDLGEIVGFAKVTRDVTERRQAQKALEQARESLFQAQKMEAIGQLTGGVAHDFNNLLMAIRASLELVRKRVAYDPKISPFVENAIQGAERGAALTQRMLAFARQRELKTQNVDVPALVRGMAELMTRTLGEAVSVETRFPMSVPLVATDPNQLETAILNVVLNARDAMPNGGPITITATPESVADGNPHQLKPGQYVCLAVIDRGLGMDEETLQRATEPFFTTKGVGKGTGLGLPMVHGLAEQSGGRLVLKSSPGEGTTVEIWLPVARQPVARESADARSAAPDAGEDQPKLGVLAVDDDALVLLNTVAMLEDLGHTVHQASNGPAALEVLRREPIDLVLTDQGMPGMTGIQLAQAIEREWPGLPVIIVTGYAELPEGAPRLPKLEKPFLHEQLSSVIERVKAGRAG